MKKERTATKYGGGEGSCTKKADHDGDSVRTKTNKTQERTKKQRERDGTENQGNKAGPSCS